MAALNALGHAVSGSVGTAISTGAVYPLDLVTTRLKTQRQLGDKAQYDGVVDAFRTITSREGGVTALYSGLGPDVAKSVVDSFLFFGFYNYFRRRSGKPRVLEELAIGALAGACARAFTTPVSNVVTRKQMGPRGGGREDETLREALAAIKKESGLLGLWSGYSATLVLTMNPSITFFVNRRLATRIIPALEEEDIPVAWVAFLLAAVSKATATAVTYPFQTGKTRLQMASRSAKHSSEKPSVTNAEAHAMTSQSFFSRLLQLLDETIFGVIIRIVKQEGLRALYDGLRGELLKSFFSHGITMLTKGILHRLVVRLWYLLVPYLHARRLSINK
ncbi:peroxisomal adenine nucleotide transporter 1 [Stachybotrys elegans]|uniref:Peroxisomal adenine nucleotide transporter 1 n=1 Tax=Stachybotrys elegans TaxID=80388 RepID=A0A8K0SRI5_9HYPO|nr:peroxisomal adenine nucleotide transporter 1 [Stachybotrys elegans]